ncbi:MAG TPA: hypothetical protein VL100_00915 [Croceibacterium sp.]|nr:hypothetical protein [Croceibacterium sp.]
MNAPIKTRAGNLTQALVNKITADCGAPHGSAQIKGSELIIFRSEDALITRHLLKALQETGETTLSSIGNQRHEVLGKH